MNTKATSLNESPLQKTRPPRNRYLLVSRVGRNGRFQSWLKGNEPPIFDLFLSFYNPSFVPSVTIGNFMECRPGFKVEGYGGFLLDNANLVDEYDYVAFFDEDLEASADAINGAFRLCSKYNLKIAQPALTKNSYFTFAALLQQRAFDLRFTNFIEMMCPIFRRDILKKIEPLYRSGYESGIDLIWCNLVAEGPRDFAVLDAFPVYHTEPVGGAKEANGFTGKRTYMDDISEIITFFSLPLLCCVPYAGIRPDGRIVTDKLRLFLSALSLLLAVPLKQDKWKRLRFVLNHLRHITARQALNLRREWPAEPCWRRANRSRISSASDMNQDRSMERSSGSLS